MKKIFTLIAIALFGGASISAQTCTTLWEGEYTFDESWGGSVSISTEHFATVKDGDKIVVTAEQIAPVSWEWGSQVFIKTLRDGWDAISGTISVNKDGSADYEVNISDNTIVLSESKIETTMIDELQQYGLVVQGIDAKITKIDLISSVATSIKELTLVEGHTILAEEFDSYPDDYQVKISIVNDSDPYESRNNWGIGGFANADNWTPSYTFTGLDGTTFDIYVTIGDFKTAAKAGTDSYVPGQYHGNGITFNIYNDCRITGVYVMIPDATGISSAIAQPMQNDVIYNLAGQKVDAGYKGIVIKNGKKIVVK